MSDHLTALRLFARVARLGSFSAAGRELGFPQSTVSRTIATLERKIGAQLLLRSTRAVTLTDSGTDFLARVESILDALDDAETAARGGGELRGVLRVAAGTSLGVREVVPRLPDFLRRHPNLRLDLVLEDRRQDLVAEGVDVALRFGALADSTATARLIRNWPRILAASPVYLTEAGWPAKPADLAGHAFILGPAGANPQLTFRRNDAVQSVRIDGRLRVRASEGGVAAAVAGLGVIIASPAACRHELESGALVRILEGWDLGSVELNAVFPAGRATKRAAHVFVDALSGFLRQA